MPNAPIYSDPHYASGGPTAADFATYDARLTAGVNGDDGSAHAPASLITIASFGLKVTGPTLVNRGARLHANSSPTIFCQDNDWPVLEPGNPFATHVVTHDSVTGRGQPTYHFQARVDGGMQSWSPMLDLSDGQGMRPAVLRVPIRAHEASTLTSVTVTFRVGVPHPNVPATMPSVRVLRMDPAGNVVPLTSQAAGADVNGNMFVPKPSSGTLWYALGASQSLVVPCDQNNVIAVGSYAYYVEITDEQGLTGYPWQLTYKQPAEGTVTGGSLSGTPSSANVDGMTMATGDRVLVTNISGAGSNTAFTGLWIVNGSGAWTRATDLALATDFSQGMICPVYGGTVFGNTFFHADPSVSAWSQKADGSQQGLPGIPFLLRGSWIPGQPKQSGYAYPQGTIWDAVRATYANIGDLRAQ